MRFLLLISMVAACKTERGWQGATGVGNPGSAAQTLARLGDIDVFTADVFAVGYDVTFCDGTSERIPVERVTDLLSPEPTPVPGGEWCSFGAVWEPPLIIEGRAENGEGGTFRLEIDTTGPTFRLPVPFVMDEHPLLVQIASHGGINKEGLNLHREKWVEVMPADPEHRALVDAIERGSALYIDSNVNGQVDPEETLLQSGPLYQGDAGS